MIDKLNKRLAFLKVNKELLPEDIYYSEIDHIAYEAANQIMDSSRIDDYLHLRDLKPEVQNKALRLKLAEIYTNATKEEIGKVNLVNQIL